MNDNISDVIVKTNEGYLFDVYFDEVFSEYFVEYMGQADSSYIPEVNITYTEASGKIDVTASGNINKITITNNGKEVAGGSNTTLSYTATNSGIYKIAVETKEGLTRYGYVNVGLKKDKLKAPEIKVAAGNEGSNGWYRTDVNVEIDPTNTNGQTMHYRLTGATTQEETPVTNITDTTTIPVTAAGLTKVIAWVELEEDGKTYRSEYSYYNVKIDNKAPGAPVAKITATEGNQIGGSETSQTSTYWYKTNVELEITAEDENSGIYGYTYSITGTKSVSETALIGKVQKITFETDGTYTLIIRAIDKAGNQSNPYTITVYKDSTPPNVFTPNISNITNTGFTISAYTMDDVSGIAKYEYYVNNDKKYEGTENTYIVSGLNKDTTYGVYVNAIDKAGNVQASSAISVYTAGSTSGGTTGGGNTGPDGSTIGYGTYTIFYEANLPEGVESRGLPKPRTFAHGEKVMLTYEYPQALAAGYNFLAWSTDREAKETLYYPGNEITGYGNITLYAIWTDKCTIIYNANGGSETPASQSFYNGQSIVLPSNAGEYGNNKSATLLGWAYTADNNYVYYKPGEAYTDYAHGSCTLYAVWDLGITVNIDLHGATYTKTYDDIVPLKFTYATGLGVKLPTDAGTHPNTNITHWKWAIGDADGSNMGSYWDGTAGTYFSDTTANGKTLHAMWDCQINFNSNGGDEINPSQFLMYKEVIALPSSAGKRDGWSSYGWSTEQAATKVKYQFGATYSDYANGTNKTLYALWGRDISTLELGDYIAYTPADSNPSSYNTKQDGSERSGSDNQTISKDTLNWRVLKTSGNILTLISEIPTGSLTLKGASGYNEGVKLLNDACSILYSNNELAAKGRNVNMSDIYGLLEVTTEEQKKALYSYYGKSANQSITTLKIPSILADDVAGFGTLIGPSEQTKWYGSGYAYPEATGSIGNAMAFNQSVFVDTMARECGILFGGMSSYWVATRSHLFISSGSFTWRYCLQTGSSSGVSWSGLTTSSTYQNEAFESGKALRPLIEVDFSQVIVGATGDGTSELQYSLNRR